MKILSICNLDFKELYGQALQSETDGNIQRRMIAEKNPHQIIEGLLIGAYAIGAKKSSIYINGNYKKQAEILRIAIDQAREKEFLGKGILGSAVDIEMEIFEGAGAYICGEETALMNSIEGKRGRTEAQTALSADFGTIRQADNCEQR